MKKFINNKSLQVSSLVIVGLLSGAQDAAAETNTFSTIAENVVGGVSEVPGLVTGISYMLGVLLAVLGVLKIKDHVENPSSTPLKEGIARVSVAGGLFAVPIVTEAMTTLVEGDGAGITGADVAIVNEVTLGTGGGE